MGTPAVLGYVIVIRATYTFSCLQALPYDEFALGYGKSTLAHTPVLNSNSTPSPILLTGRSPTSAAHFFFFLSSLPWRTHVAALLEPL